MLQVSGAVISNLQDGFHKDYNVKLQLPWLEQCVIFLHSIGGIDLSRVHGGIQDMVYQQLLLADLRNAVASQLPEHFYSASTVMLQGKYILQIEELMNIADNYERQYQDNNENRMLKFCMTDGRQRLFGIEYQRIPSLSVHSLPGSKVIISDVVVRRGLLLLTGSNTIVLGGQVAPLVTLEQNKRANWEQSQKGFIDNGHDSNTRNICISSRATTSVAATTFPTISSSTATTFLSTSTSAFSASPTSASSASTHREGSKRTALSLSNNITYRRKQAREPPFVYLADAIKKFESNIIDATTEFTILAALTKVIPPLLEDNIKYPLSVLVEDGSMSVPAVLGDDFIESLIGMHAPGFRKNPRAMRTETHQARMLSSMVTLMLVKFMPGIPTSPTKRCVVKLELLAYSAPPLPIHVLAWCIEKLLTKHK